MSTDKPAAAAPFEITQDGDGPTWILAKGSEPWETWKASGHLPEAFHDAGQFYWITVEAVRREHRIYIAGARPIPLPRWRVQDIDTEADWAHAEKLYELSQTASSH